MKFKFIICFYLILFLFGNTAHSETVLTEDFNDASYTDGTPALWEIDWTHSGDPAGTRRDFDVPTVLCESGNCFLEGHTTSDGFSKNTAMIYTDNPTMVGSWQFDSRLKSTENDQWNMLVLSNDHSPYNGNHYTLVQSSNGTIYFYKNVNGTNTTLFLKDGYSFLNSWVTIKMTRNSEGLWKFFVNDTFIGSIVDNTLTNLPYLMIGRYGNTDNIIVDNANPDLLTEDFDDASYTDGTPELWEIDWTHPGDPAGTNHDYDVPTVLCEGTNCFLEGHTTSDGFSKNTAMIYTDNPTMTGSWQFDSRLKSTENDAWNMLVLSNDHSPYNGNHYTLVQNSNGTIYFYKNVNGTNTTLFMKDGYSFLNSWVTMKMTRNSEGLWKFFVNDTFIGSIVDNTLTNLPYLMIGRYGNTDNVIVKEAEISCN